MQGRRLHIDSLLVTPIQRIPRYLLLLRSLLKYTPPSHPDFPKLSLVLHKMEEVATYIDKEKLKYDNITVILKLSHIISGYDGVWPSISAGNASVIIERGDVLRVESQSYLMPGRKFIKEGNLMVYDRERLKFKKRYFFLFTDILLMTRHKRGSILHKSANGRYLFIDSLQMRYATTLSQSSPAGNVCLQDRSSLLPECVDPSVSLFADHNVASPRGFVVVQSDGSHYVLQAKDKEEQDAWLAAFQEVATTSSFLGAGKHVH